MSNFITTAIGEGHYKRSEVEQLEVDKVGGDTPKSIPLEVLKKIDAHEQEVYETLKIQEMEENKENNFIKLRMVGMSFEDYDNHYSNIENHDIDVMGEGVPGIERLRVSKVEVEKSSIETLDSQVEFSSEERTEYLDKVRDVVKEVSRIETLPDGAEKLINLLVDSLVSPNTIQIEPNSGDSKLLPREVLVDDRKSFEDYYNNLDKELIKFKLENNLSEEVYESLKMRIQDSSTPSIEGLDMKSDLTESELYKIYKLSSEMSSEMVSLKMSSLSSEEISTNFWTKYARIDTSSPVALVTNVITSLGGYLGLSDTAIDTLERSVNTLNSRFGLSSNIPKNITSDFYKFKGYADLAVQIAHAAEKGNVSTENLIFAATFWYFLKPIKLTAPTTEGALGVGNASFFKSPIPNEIAFKGRESIRGIELFDTSKWDIKLEAIPNYTDKRIPLPANYFNGGSYGLVDSSSVNNNESQSLWIPIDGFSIDLTDISMETTKYFNYFSLGQPSLVNFPMKGSISLLENNALWVNNWLRDYVKICYGDPEELDNNKLLSKNINLGNICNFYYQEMSLKLTLYIWDSIDNLENLDEVYKVIKRTLNKNLEVSIPKRKYLRKYVFYVLIQPIPTTFKGNPSPTLMDKINLSFNIVGSEMPTVLDLDQSMKQ